MSPSPLRVCLVGQDYWCARLNAILRQHESGSIASQAVSLGARSFAKALIRAAAADVTVRIGFRPGAKTWRGLAVDFWWGCLRRIAPHKKRFFYWIGTDVNQTLNGVRTGTIRKGIFEAARRDRHLADAPWLAMDLASIGIEAKVIPIFAGRFGIRNPPPMPGRFTVLTYIPEERHAFYGSSMISTAASILPELQFLVLGGTGKWMTKPLPNVRFLGWRDDPSEFYAASSVVVRMVEHDGMSGTVAEALSFGRHVVYSYPVPHCHQVNFGNTRRLIEVLAELSSLPVLPVNEDGRQYAATEFNEAASAHSLAAYLGAPI